jgi:hypothetical protein
MTKASPGNEHPPEEPQRQEPIEPLGARIFLGSREAEEGHPSHFERADLYILRRQSRKYYLPSVHTRPL